VILHRKDDIDGDGFDADNDGNNVDDVDDDADFANLYKAALTC